MTRLAKLVIGLMTAESLVTAVAYAATGGWKMAIYWLGIAMVNAVAYTF